MLIDEIGDIPLTLQGKLLRVLQDQTYERVGDPATIKVDIRFIAATNQDLEEKVSRGTFRKDLYYRLNVIHIPIPPLRKRIEDIKPLVYAFLTKHNEIFGMKVSDINLGALTALQAYDWPGNIRELENVIERALNFAVDDTIKLENLPPRLCTVFINSEISDNEQDSPSSEADQKSHLTENVMLAYWCEREKQENDTISRAINQAKGNRSEAARFLGISRSWLYKKMDKLGLR